MINKDVTDCSLGNLDVSKTFDISFYPSFLNHTYNCCFKNPTGITFLQIIRKLRAKKQQNDIQNQIIN